MNAARMTMPASRALIAVLLVSAAGCDRDGLETPADAGAGDLATPDLVALPPDFAQHCVRAQVFAPPMAVPIGAPAYETQLANFDGLPGTDVAVLTGSAPYLVVLPGLPAGGVGPAIGSPRATFAAGITAGDLDGDGVAELIGETNFNDVETYWNDGHGHFTSVGMSVLDGANDIHVGDLNGDGRLDFIGLDASNPMIHTFTNEAFMGGVTFRQGMLGPAPGVSLLVGLALADLDGNGTPEVVVSHAAPAPGLVVLEDAGRSRVVDSYGTGKSVGRVTAGDLDGDGRPEVVIGSGDQMAVVLPNAGARGLGAPIALPAPLGTGSLVISDVDGDGRPDLVFLHPMHGAVGVLFNEGGLVFSAPVDSPANGGATGMSVADLDGDGHPDIAVANPAEWEISILYNRCR